MSLLDRTGLFGHAPDWGEPFQPSGFAEAIADRLPKGNHIEYSDLDHFGPFVDPVRIARIVDTFADTLEP
ncbi:MAG: hypothetical protein EBY80_16165 [Actinobacteria bacterium]|nr:hypothetical protein [Actinomycetota bacterium]